MSDARNAFALIAAAMILGLAAFWYAPMLGTGFITHTDEYATLDRSSSMIATGDWWTVHSRNLPSFKKPPMQYWMTAGLMESGADLTVALRLPSLVFALACLAATGVLAWALLPASPWVAPAAMLLCASSLDFWILSTSALLDTGAAFFATLAVAATIRALDRPGWWYVAAAAVALGALQKAPIGLFLVLGYLVVLSRTTGFHGVDVTAIRRSAVFRRAVRIAIAGALAWPLFQLLRHLNVTVVEELLGQTVGRFAPTGFDDDLSDFSGLYGMIIGGEPILRGLGIAALVWLPWRLRRRELLPLPVLFGIFVFLMYLAAGGVSGRYTLVFVPWLAAALAAVLLSFPLPGLVRAAAVAGIAALSLGPLKPEAALGLGPDEERMQAIEALRSVGQALRPDEALVICNWRPRLFPPGAVTYYAANGRPFDMPMSPDDVAERVAEGTMEGPFRGLCPTADFDEMARTLDGLVRVEETNGITHWTADGATLR